MTPVSYIVRTTTKDARRFRTSPMGGLFEKKTSPVLPSRLDFWLVFFPAFCSPGNPILLQYSPSGDLSTHKHRLSYRRQNFINKLFTSKRGTSTSMITYCFICENYPLNLSENTPSIKNDYFSIDSLLKNILRSNHVWEFENLRNTYESQSHLKSLARTKSS
jgi:hypothetical protein